MKYHLGCGNNYFQGYVNVDFPQSEHTIVNIKADLYADLIQMNYEKCGEIRSHHVFEHFNYIESLVLLIKWTEALNLGGILRIDLPDMEALSKGLSDAITKKDIQRYFKIIRMLYGSHEANWAYHINGWTLDSLSYILEKLGYSLLNYNTYGNPFSAEFPNCGINIVFKKDIEILNLKDIARDFLKQYVHPTAEYPLLQEFHKQFELLLCKK